jgi:parallel beta-helix repeat protein
MLLDKKIFFIIVATISLSLVNIDEGDAQPQTATVATAASTSSSPSSLRITYDSKERLITVTCRSARLTDIANKLSDESILKKEESSPSSSPTTSATVVGKGNVWLLNAGIVIDKGANFYINSTDTKWLKIIEDGKKDNDAYPIQVSGSLKVDSVKITSWNPKTNDYALTPDSERHGTKTHVGTPRPYIRVEEGATGTTDITNSEIAYLGYEAGVGAGRSGFRYDGGDGSIIRNNDIHHLWSAFYSREVGGLIIENNDIHHNGHYGLDPHTGTRDMIIRNNTVHDNGSIGIICSLNCSHITIENNKVYSNARIGIMFSRNMHDSIARNNIVGNEDRCIFISQSHNNEIYNNRVSDCDTGINLIGKSSKNTIYNNTIANSTEDIVVEEAGKGNEIYSNKVINTAAGTTSGTSTTATENNNNNNKNES